MRRAPLFFPHSRIPLRRFPPYRMSSCVRRRKTDMLTKLRRLGGADMFTRDSCVCLHLKPTGTQPKIGPKPCAAKWVFEAFAFHGIRRMASEAWENCRRKLAVFPPKVTSAMVSNHIADSGRKLFAAQLLAELPRGKPAIRAAGPNKLAGVARWPLRMRATAEIVTKFRS